MRFIQEGLNCFFLRPRYWCNITHNSYQHSYQLFETSWLFLSVQKHDLVLFLTFSFESKSAKRPRFILSNLILLSLLLWLCYCKLFRDQNLFFTSSRRRSAGNILFQLVARHRCIVSLKTLLCVLPLVLHIAATCCAKYTGVQFWATRCHNLQQDW